jgi:hypothetical protein
MSQGSIGWDLLENDLRLNDSTDVLHVPNVFGADDADLNLFQPACFFLCIHADTDTNCS